MILVIVYNSREDATTGDVYTPSLDFYFESLKAATEFIDCCLAQGKSVILSLEENRTERK